MFIWWNKKQFIIFDKIFICWTGLIGFQIDYNKPQRKTKDVLDFHLFILKFSWFRWFKRFYYKNNACKNRNNLKRLRYFWGFWYFEQFWKWYKPFFTWIDAWKLWPQMLFTIEWGRRVHSVEGGRVIGYSRRLHLSQNSKKFSQLNWASHSTKFAELNFTFIINIHSFRQATLNNKWFRKQFSYLRAFFLYKLQSTRFSQPLLQQL